MLSSRNYVEPQTLVLPVSFVERSIERLKVKPTGIHLLSWIHSAYLSFKDGTSFRVLVDHTMKHGDWDGKHLLGLPVLPYLAQVNALEDWIMAIWKYSGKMIFLDSFNLPVEQLPELLVYLDFGNSFNSPIGALPRELRYLSLGPAFEQKLPELPRSIRIVAMNFLQGKNLQGSLTSVFPDLILEELALPDKRRPRRCLLDDIHQADPTLANNTLNSVPIVAWEFPCDAFTVNPFRGFPWSLQDIEEFGCKCRGGFHGAIRFVQSPNPYISGELVSRSFSVGEFVRPLSGLFRYVTHLKLSDDYDQELPFLPPTLKVLQLGNAFDSQFTPPEELECLIIGNSFSLELPVLPSGLLSLSLGNSYNKSLPTLPKGLKHLFLGTLFSKTLPVLPGSLEALSMANVAPRLGSIRIPVSVKYIALNSPNRCHETCFWVSYPLKCVLVGNENILVRSYCNSFGLFNMFDVNFRLWVPQIVYVDASGCLPGLCEVFPNLLNSEQ